MTPYELLRETKRILRELDAELRKNPPDELRVDSLQRQLEELADEGRTLK